ncbi:AlpA family transcriptional regulator [Pectobacterium carotovorum]|uniref:helix-turn-helix transcriptional regulator n=1 Tax=Pectobacterium carotovorum TaxID=554 RepID=UPI001CF4FE95|nr:AlpA family transcriptional regulator [Pectobacterium carotovorum]MCA6969758.1 AlpA family transcriptional regulator [Pectobacterium carotovorum]MCH4996803.1 AlpA family transcriptional regulator [Pectobacterium carotovorum]
MTNRIIRKAEVLYRCGISNATLYRLIAKGHFPCQRSLSPDGRAVGWLESDIDEWVSSRGQTL